MPKWIKTTFEVARSLATLILIVLLSFTVYLSASSMKDQKPVVRDVNTAIIEMIQDGKESEVYDFYDSTVGNRRLTVLLVSTALLYKIPVNYFVALAYTESRFDPDAVNVNRDADGNILSYDYGLFQLNSLTFPQYIKEYLYIPENNARLAAQYLTERFAKYGNWYETIISFNAGGTLYVKNKSIKHLVSVLSMNETLDNKFVEEFCL